jgi:triacylglycerol lipase
MRLFCAFGTLLLLNAFSVSFAAEPVEIEQQPLTEISTAHSQPQYGSDSDPVGNLYSPFRQFLNLSLSFATTSPVGFPLLDFGRRCFPSKKLFEIDPDATSFSESAAYWMVWLARSSYYPIKAIEPMLQHHQFSEWKFIQVDRTGFYAFVALWKDTLFLSFRGSQDLTDWMENFDLAESDASQWGYRGKVHRGFDEVLQSGYDQVRSALEAMGGKSRTIWVTGHSLGGALSQLAAARLSREGFNIKSVYTFGQPRIGNDEFSNEFESSFKGSVYRVVNNLDLAARMPPPLQAASEFLSLFPRHKQLQDTLRHAIHSRKYTHTKQTASLNESGKLGDARQFQEEDDRIYWKSIQGGLLEKDLGSLWVKKSIGALIDHHPDVYICKVYKSVGFH